MPNMTKISITKNGNTQSVTSKDNKIETLNDVILAFAVWRTNKKKSRESVPEELWDAACRLTKMHSKSTIATALRLNGNVLRVKAECYFARKTKVKSINTTKSISTVTKPWTITCERPDGLMLHLLGSSEVPSSIHQTISNFLQ